MILPAHFQDVLGPDLSAEIAAKARTRHLAAGESLLEPGTMVTAMPIVLSGLLKVSRVDEAGRALFLYHLGPEESCAMTFTCCMDRQASEIQAVAEEDAEVLLVPVEAMGDWLVRFPAWKAFVMRTVRERFNELLRTIDQIAFQNLDQRLVAYLKEKARAAGGTLVNLSHEKIAEELATSRVVVSRLLKKLEGDGKVVLFRNQVKLLAGLLPEER
ncbi:MAG: Crp/Fnr family transcriptional regulator [Fibrobacteria bacterium]|jgi:CRP/FNR family transcriptional regulator|nr:Crp/Fnr family transcriptional regulator [Fibrobacteria bacterium]